MAVDFVSRSAQGTKRRAQLGREELRHFPGREVPAFVEPVVMDELGVSPFCPTPQSCIDLIREDAHGNRDDDVLRGKEGQLVFPIQTRSGTPRGKAFGWSAKIGPTPRRPIAFSLMSGLAKPTFWPVISNRLVIVRPPPMGQF
jgi:hypothetical protein